jgi:hypothetical protein
MFDCSLARHWFGVFSQCQLALQVCCVADSWSQPHSAEPHCMRYVRLLAATWRVILNCTPVTADMLTFAVSCQIAGRLLPRSGL